MLVFCWSLHSLGVLSLFNPILFCPFPLFSVDRVSFTALCRLSSPVCDFAATVSYCCSLSPTPLRSPSLAIRIFTHYVSHFLLPPVSLSHVPVCFNAFLAYRIALSSLRLAVVFVFLSITHSSLHSSTHYSILYSFSIHSHHSSSHSSTLSLSPSDPFSLTLSSCALSSSLPFSAIQQNPFLFPGGPDQSSSSSSSSSSASESTSTSQPADIEVDQEDEEDVVTPPQSPPAFPLSFQQQQQQQYQTPLSPAHAAIPLPDIIRSDISCVRCGQYGVCTSDGQCVSCAPCRGCRAQYANVTIWGFCAACVSAYGKSVCGPLIEEWAVEQWQKSEKAIEKERRKERERRERQRRAGQTQALGWGTLSV